jgi:hypothetical protein
LILWLVDVGLTERRWSHVLGAGLAWGMALLAGHPQSAMYVLYGALLYAFYRARQLRSSWRWSVLAQVAWSSIGLGVAAVHLLPAFEFMRLSVRSSLTYQELAGGFAFRDFVQFLLPGAFTHWSPMYVGVLPLFLAAMACVLGWRQERRGKVLFWLALAGVSLVLSLGGKGALYRLFYWAVPGFRLFRSQERAIYLTSFSLAVLAGWGWRWLWMDRGRSAVTRRASRGLLVLGAAALVGLLSVWLARDALGTEAVDWLQRLSLLAVLVWASWALVRWVSGRAAWGAILGLALVLLDLGLVTVPKNLAPGRAESRVYDDSWLGPVLEAEGLYRIANEWGLPGNIGCWLRRQDLYGASPLRLSAHKAMVDGLPHWRLWQLFGVRYVATWEHDLPGPWAWERAARQGEEWAKDTVYLFSVEPGLGRAWVVHRARRVEDGAALALLADPAYDPSVEVLLPEGAPEGTAAGGSLLSSTAEVTSYAPERFVVHTDAEAPGWLVLGEWTYPGWKARVDGQREDIYRAHYALRAVPLAAGRHVVEFRYRPASVYIGAVTSVATLVVVGIVGSILWRRKK